MKHYADQYTELAHGTMCKGCGVMVGDTVRHDLWHDVQDRVIAAIAADARKGAGCADLHTPLGGGTHYEEPDSP